MAFALTGDERTTVEDVLSLLDVDNADIEDADINGYLVSAHLTVERHLNTSDFSDAELMMIEARLAAHDIVLNYERLEERVGVGNLSTSWVTQDGEGLERTEHGRQAVTLSGGALRGAEKPDIQFANIKITE